MKLNRKKRMVLLTVFAILLVAIIAGVLLMGKPCAKKEKSGFIITGHMDEKGWNGMKNPLKRSVPEDFWSE